MQPRVVHATSTAGYCRGAPPTWFTPYLASVSGIRDSARSADVLLLLPAPPRMSTSTSVLLI